MPKASHCDDNGHTYELTPSPGYYRCFRPVRYGKHGNVTEDCGALALCPGCVGHRIAGSVNLFCAEHSTCDLFDFPLVLPADPSQKQPDTTTQLTFF